MAFDYGSIDLGINNPFKVEGIIRALAGAVIIGLGIVALLSVQTLIADDNRSLGISTAVVGFGLLTWGLACSGGGLFQMFRFFVGRSVPASLAPNVEKSQSRKRVLEVTYNHHELEQMLQGRQNISFEEPDDWFSRMVHSVFRRLLYLPYAYRNLAQRIARAITRTIAAILTYCLAWFSGVSGITNVTNTPVMDWLAAILIVYLLISWFQAGPKISRLLEQKRTTMPEFIKIAITVTLAIFTPVVLSIIHEQGSPLPSVPLSIGALMATLLLLSAISAVLFAFLIRERAQTSNPVVEVSEYRDNWQESIHPQEMFIHFENIVMANRRYKEVPNRIYRDFDAALAEQGSADKGDFSGEMIQETQPIFHTVPTTQVFYYLRILGTALGAILFVLVAFALFWLPDELLTANPEQLSTSGIALTVYVVILGIFARLLTNFSHAFWAEMQFESLLVYFQCKGTYTESKLSTGTSIYDSTRSENTVVRTSMTPWLITSRVISSTFAASGSLNLERKRYVLELHKADLEMTDIVQEIKSFLGKRETIANVTNEKDLSSAMNMHQLNQSTRAQLPNAEHPPIDETRIEDLTGQPSQESEHDRE